MNIAVQHFIKRSKQEGVPETDGETPFTTPGQGLKPAQIKGVVLHQEYGYGVGGMMLIKYNPYLLLRDGTIYSHPEVCAYNLDVARSREVEPGKWGPWKLEDTTFNTRGQFTTSSTGGGSFNGSGGSVTAYRSKDGAGTYTFDGFSLELKYDNGKIVRKNFCFYADSKDVWTFGTRPYTPSDSNKKK